VHDPLTIAKASETVALDAGSRPRFLAAAKELQSELGVAQTLDARMTGAN
jgi:hypothetical protein